MIYCKKFFFLCILISLTNCQTIDKKINETTDKENKMLSEFLRKINHPNSLTYSFVTPYDHAKVRS